MNLDFSKMKFLKENPYYFFEYLKTYKKGDGLELLSEISALQSLNSVKSMSYYQISSFKTFICELIYNAINLFPEISEYTIRCENKLGWSSIQFSRFEELSDDTHPCLGKLTTSEIGSYCLQCSDIKHLYMHNRHKNIDINLINTIISILLMTDDFPKVTTSFTINKTQLKNKID
jgi:hypothetical protein